MSLTEKQAFVDRFREKVQQAPVLYLTDFSGLDVKSMTLLRKRLRDSGAEYLVVKNRLVKRAVADLDMPDISEALLGPTGVVLGYEGVVEPAKVVSDFAKEHDDRAGLQAGYSRQEDRLRRRDPAACQASAPRATPGGVGWCAGGSDGRFGECPRG